MTPNKDKVNEWIGRAYATAKEHGFHDTDHKDGHYLMLITSEIAEAMEADRKGIYAKRFDLERLLTIDGMFELVFPQCVKDSVEDELSDVVIRCCDYLGCKGLTFGDAFEQPTVFPNGFYDTFAEKGWEWVKILTNEKFSTEANVAGLLYEVLWYCEEAGIDIEKHVGWKMRYNASRPAKHGKAY